MPTGYYQNPRCVCGHKFDQHDFDVDGTDCIGDTFNHPCDCHQFVEKFNPPAQVQGNLTFMNGSELAAEMKVIGGKTVEVMKPDPEAL